MTFPVSTAMFMLLAGVERQLRVASSLLEMNVLARVLSACFSSSSLNPQSTKTLVALGGRCVPPAR